jgi:GNAT superfamily N-acetyltransferase
VPESLVVRPARAEDAEAISGLINSLFRYFLSDPDRPEDAEAFFRKISVEGIAEVLADERYRYQVAEAGGILAGVVGMRDGAHLYHLFVAEPFHGQGIGARLWDTARREARARGNPGRFTVNSSRYAIPVYERLGFVATDALQVMDGLAYLPMALLEPDAHGAG